MVLRKKRLLLTLFRLEEGQQEILHRLDRLERGGGQRDQGQEDWLNRGIESILSYKVGEEERS